MGAVRICRSAHPKKTWWRNAEGCLEESCGSLGQSLRRKCEFAMLLCFKRCVWSHSVCVPAAVNFDL